MYLKILDKNIVVECVDGAYIFEDIRYTDKMERDVVWRIYVKDNRIYREMCINKGKVRVFDPIESIGRNIGKKNETTDSQQAILEAWSMWKKKKDSVKDVIFPMLAQDYRKHSNKMIFPFAVSPKIDGIRAISEHHDVVEMSSRQGKPFTYLENIKKDLEIIYQTFPGIIFDGEIYSHEISFSRISGAVRKTREKSVDDDLLEYWIFDIVCDDTYKKRMDILKGIESYYNSRGMGHLKFVYYEEVVSRGEVKWWHSEYVKRGFEGVICRNIDGVYKQKFRSYDLQKYKDFEDTEFKIVGVKDGKGSEKEAILFVCECGDQTFDVRPRGSIEKRRDMWKRGDEYMGKMLTVRYQNTGIQEEGGMPRFPVGIDVRDYE
jgi:ATP-dependent DNA ligase